MTEAACTDCMGTGIQGYELCTSCLGYGVTDDDTSDGKGPAL